MLRHVAIALACSVAMCIESKLPAQAAPIARCSYDTCALSIIPRLSGLDVVRGASEERIATLGFLAPTSVNRAFLGNAAAESHASRALRIRRVASIMTDLGGVLALSGALHAAATRTGRSASIAISLGGLTLVGASVLPQFAADAELSRAVREYNTQFAR